MAGNTPEALTFGFDIGIASVGWCVLGENRIVDGRVAGARFVITLPRGEPPQDDGSQAAVLPDNAIPCHAMP